MKIPAETRRRVLDATLAAERELCGELSVTTLADWAGLSDKHFQRAFRAVLGEAPKAYLRRLQLQRAAYLLKWSELTILEVAVRTGYDTHAGFTKAFTRAYGHNPQEFRAASGVAPYLHMGSGPGGAERLEATPLPVRIEQVPDQRVAAMRHVGPVETSVDAWKRLVPWARQRGLLGPEAVLLGVHNDYWDDNAQDSYRYDAAVVVPADFKPDDAVNMFTIHGGPVAMTEFRGSLDDADQAWRRLVDQWLPVSGLQPRSAFAYDCYPVELFTGSAFRRLLQSLTGYRATLCLPVSKYT
ncbi:Right origin-binding protein [Posidoniimonas corsicana]|uniref:Right origin-binding protein n=1 Tax=Posidoniimonas corsicana TaxID=1938618 RepID=A0A5C5UVT4_9BACT|nr:GyrI-like domain-containing protein [Posidoniimonas corsicana]TWT30461.1 Right origin-binding protein [Posidoniimonas corsicana]